MAEPLFALYPHATQRLLDPEATKPVHLGGEPTITPVQFILHTHGFAGSSAAVGRYFARGSVKVESHDSVTLAGETWQFQRYDRQADANGAANGFRLPGIRGLAGAISSENEDNPRPGNPFTEAQLNAQGMKLAWLIHHGAEIPLKLCRHERDPGVGWHSMYRAWNPNAHACPGDAREKQVPRIIDIATWFLAMARAQPRLTDQVDQLSTPDRKGAWILQRDGGVITTGTARFYGSYPGLKPEQRQGIHRFGDILPHGAGYKLLDEHGHEYHFPAR